MCLHNLLRMEICPENSPPSVGLRRLNEFSVYFFGKRQHYRFIKLNIILVNELTSFSTVKPFPANGPVPLFLLLSRCGSSLLCISIQFLSRSESYGVFNNRKARRMCRQVWEESEWCYEFNYSVDLQEIPFQITFEGKKLEKFLVASVVNCIEKRLERRFKIAFRFPLEDAQPIATQAVIARRSLNRPFTTFYNAIFPSTNIVTSPQR